jgi:hypothetical protein
MESQSISIHSQRTPIRQSLPFSNPSQKPQPTPAPQLEGTISLTKKSRDVHPVLKASVASKGSGQFRSQQSSDG